MAEVQEPVVDNESRWKGTHHDLPHEPPQTRYSVMAVQANNIRTRHNASAAVFSWITLAGFVTLPNTFTSLQTSSSLSESTGGRIAQDTVHNVQLLPFAGVLCCIGLSGTCFLWRKHQGNYIWLVGHLFQPGLANSLIALLSTLINILTTQGGHVSVTAKIAVSIISAICGSMLCLYIVYDRILSTLKKSYDRDAEKPKDLRIT